MRPTRGQARKSGLLCDLRHPNRSMSITGHAGGGVGMIAGIAVGAGGGGEGTRDAVVGAGVVGVVVGTAVIETSTIGSAVG